MHYSNCTAVRAPPHPPSPVQNLTVSQLTHFTSGDNLIVSMLVQWIAPVYSNGVLTEFELSLNTCLGDTQLWNRNFINVSVYNLFWSLYTKIGFTLGRLLLL